MNTDKQNLKNEILRAALELFAQKGYESTTVNDILQRVGASKGGFYHHFKSKEEIIEQIAESYVAKMAEIADGICSRKDIDAIEKFNQIIIQVQLYKKREDDTRRKLKSAFKEKNLKLERKIINKISAIIKPVYQRIIQEGSQAGLFRVFNPEELPSFLLAIAFQLNSSIEELYVECFINEKIDRDEFLRKLDYKLSFYEDAINRILDPVEGSVRIKEAFLNRF